MTQSLIFYYVSEPYYLSRNQIRHQFVHIGAAMVGHLVLKPVHLAMRK